MKKYTLVGIVLVVLGIGAGAFITHTFMDEVLNKQAETIVNLGEDIVEEAAKSANFEKVNVQYEADISAAKSRNENLDGMLKEFQGSVSKLRKEVRDKNRELFGKDDKINTLEEAITAAWEGSGTVAIPCPTDEDILEVEIRTACFIGVVTSIQGKVYARTSWRSDVFDSRTQRLLGSTEGFGDNLEVYRAPEETSIPKSFKRDPRTELFLDVGLSDGGFTGRVGGDWRFARLKGPAKTRIDFKLFAEAQYVANPTSLGTTSAEDIRGAVGLRFSFGKRK